MHYAAPLKVQDLVLRMKAMETLRLQNHGLHTELHHFERYDIITRNNLLFRHHHNLSELVKEAGHSRAKISKISKKNSLNPSCVT